MDIALQIKEDIQGLNQRQIHPQQSQTYIDISFQQLTYQIKNKQQKGDKNILTNLTGYCPNGQLTAILGPSGSGKTSLLNVLAKRITPSTNVTLTGEVLVNKQPYNAEKFQQFSSYVLQDDILFETLTPVELFQFVANLKYKDAKQKKEKVEDVIRALKLDKCQNTIIGGQLVKGISGGERKRCSIAMELIGSPASILLDEPTSGLDSFTAFIILNLLRTICKERNMTVVLTIHQPSADIFQLFDRILLLVQGQFIYQGPKDQIVDYFLKNGYVCPKLSNPMDYLMSIMHGESQENVKSFPKYFQMYQNQLQSQVLAEIAAGESFEIKSQVIATTLCYQIQKICGRAFMNVKRHKILVKGRLASAIFMGLLIGGIYFGVCRGSRDYQFMQSITGIMFLLSINHFMSALSPAMITFPVERAVFLKEENSKLYSTMAYFVGKSSVEIPFMILLPLVQQLIIYWMVGMNDSSGDIVVLNLFIYVLLSLCGNSIGLWAGCIFNDPKVATSLMPLFVMPIVLFSGFFKNQGNFMSWVDWIQYISPVKYAFEAAVRNEFTNVKMIPDPVEVLSFNIGIWSCLYVLIGYVFIYRILAYIFLLLLKKRLQ